MWKFRLKLGKDRSGQGLTEYIILLTLIAIGSIMVVQKLGTKVRNKITNATVKIEKLRG